MKKQRTDSIVAVTVAKYATMYIEADTPEEAYKYAKEHCHEVDDSAFDDSEIDVDSLEDYTTEAEGWMDEIWIEDGKTISFDDYIGELEEQEDRVMEDFSLCQYDADTVQGTPNFLPGKYAVNVGKGEYMGYIFDEFVKVPENGYYAYDFILVNNGKIIAMGDEQGRCGGITCTCENEAFAERLKLSPVYDKVKHLPIASPKELEKPIYMYFHSQKEYEEFMERNKSL